MLQLNSEPTRLLVRIRLRYVLLEEVYREEWRSEGVGIYDSVVQCECVMTCGTGSDDRQRDRQAPDSDRFECKADNESQRSLNGLRPVLLLHCRACTLCPSYSLANPSSTSYVELIHPNAR